MYLPSVFGSSDPELAWSVIDEHPFGLLIGESRESVTHIPMLRGASADGRDRLRGHVARANPIAAELSGKPLLAVFRGPDCYVSPLWYAEPQRQVPTWNYVAVHVWGRASILEKPEKQALLDELCTRFEGPGGYRTGSVDPVLLELLLDDIVAFEIEVQRIAGKFKLSQNRSAEDRARVLEGLARRGAASDAAVLSWMRRLSP